MAQVVAARLPCVRPDAPRAARPVAWCTWHLRGGRCSVHTARALRMQRACSAHAARMQRACSAHAARMQRMSSAHAAHEQCVCSALVACMRHLCEHEGWAACVTQVNDDAHQWGAQLPAQPGHGGRRQGVGWREGWSVVRPAVQLAHRTRSSSMSQCKCIAAEAARFCTHISTPPKLASSSPAMWRTVSASSSWCDGAAPVSFLRGTQCGIAHQWARASTPVPVNSACHAYSRRGGSGASSVGRRGLVWRIWCNGGAARALLAENLEGRARADELVRAQHAHVHGSTGWCARPRTVAGIAATPSAARRLRCRCGHERIRELHPPPCHRSTGNQLRLCGLSRHALRRHRTVAHALC